MYVQVSCDHPETMEQDKYISFIAGVTKAAYNFFRRKLSEQVGYFMCHIKFYLKLWSDKSSWKAMFVKMESLHFEPIRFKSLLLSDASI